MNERQTHVNRSRWPALGAILIFLIVLAAYWPAIRGQFVWYDELLVAKNPLVTGKLTLRSIWFGTDFPLSLTALWLEWLAWGKNPAGYHVVNILLHLAGTVLLWRVLLRLKIPGAWLGALIFAVHPVCAGSVAWISELKNTLSLVFYLMSILWYLRFEEQAEKGSRVESRSKSEEAPLRHSTFDTRPWSYWLSLVAFVFALLAKTSTVMLPVVLLLCAWWRRGRIETRDVLRTSPYFLASLSFGLMTIWFQAHQTMTIAPAETEPFWGRLLSATKGIWFYLGKDLLPVNLSMMYPRWTVDPTAPASYVPLFALGGVFILLWRFRCGWGRPVLFGLAYFTITLFPALGFLYMYYLTLSRVSDHLQYLALIAMGALAGAGLSALLKRRWLAVGGAALVLILSISTFHRAQILANGESLWRDTLAKNPAAWTAHNNLGCMLAEQQKYDEAGTHFLASLALNPRNGEAHDNLGKILAMRGQFSEAESHFQAALAIKPNDADAQRAFGLALAQQGRVQDAVQHLQEALRLEPDVPTRLQLAGLLRGLGKIREAIAQYHQILLKNPDSLDALNNLAWLLATSPDDSLRNGTEAVQLAEKASRLTQYKEIVPLGTLAAAYAEAGRFGEAVATGEKSLALATATGQERFAAINRQLLTYYRAGKPWHEGQNPKSE